MHSFLVVGKDNKEKEDNVDKIISQKKLKKYDFEVAKIKDLSPLRSFLKLQANTPSAIVIPDIDKATTETANALLKILEEPQKNINFVLTAESIHQVLPTILSRCQIITLTRQVDIENETEEVVNQFLDSSVSKKLQKIGEIKTREDAFIFVENIILVGHKMLHSNEVPKSVLAVYLKIAQKTLLNLKMNGNISLQLTNFVINSPRNLAQIKI